MLNSLKNLAVNYMRMDEEASIKERTVESEHDGYTKSAYLPFWE